MPYDDIGICNMALSRIGCAQRITALTDLTAEGRACNLWYEKSRDVVLEAIAWPFATKRAALALVEEEPNDDWGYSYRYPSDCVRFLGFAAYGDEAHMQPRFEMSSDDTGLLIHTDEADAIAKYTRRVTVASLFSSSFADALAWRIAVDVSGELSRSMEVRQGAMAGWAMALQAAGARAVTESNRGEPADAASIRAR